ncbi:GAF and ANTAR domain-containing protein [Saccharopolyspora sp. CA-218241]|uniref:GAF and ANTAR domain-containing protein n=1 Tax=Saccharopolyspora sp. CA-218241 TaxID=3240027 RepID=UPI003D98C16B
MAEGLREFSVALAEMARDLAAQASVQATLERIVAHAVDLVEGCDQAGILLLHPDRSLETPAATSDLVRESDRSQSELGEGPCFSALVDREPVYRISDIGTCDQRWPRFGPRARDLGLGSMLGFLLYTEERELGALNLYSTRADVFTEHSEVVGWLLASHAAVLYATARTEAQLQTAISTRQLIGEAVGITMERYKVPADQAFDLLRTLSQNRNIKLREVAERITTTGELT